MRVRVLAGSWSVLEGRSDDVWRCHRRRLALRDARCGRQTRATRLAARDPRHRTLCMLGQTLEFSGVGRSQRPVRRRVHP